LLRGCVAVLNAINTYFAGLAVTGAKTFLIWNFFNMALFNMDLASELGQIKQALSDAMNGSVTPTIDRAVDRAGDNLNVAIRVAAEELNQVVSGASRELEGSIDKLSQAIDTSLGNLSTELHNQRQMTLAEVQSLIDYAASKLVKTLMVVGVLSCAFMSMMAYLLLALVK
jgi:hypothetical protein